MSTKKKTATRKAINIALQGGGAHGIAPEAVVRDVMLVHQARKEFVKVEELAALAVFLASDAAASMTAAAIPMDGGWTQH